MVMDLPGADGGESRIAHERTGPAQASAYFWVAAGALALATAAFAWEAGRIAPFTAVEANEGVGVSGLFGLEGGRFIAALGAGLLVGATALAGRRLFHSGVVGLLAALLVAIDPLTLVMGRLGTGTTVAAGFAVLALALFTYPKVSTQWVGGVALALGVLFDLRVFLWGPPLALLLLLRGHIYAAPQHLGTSLGKALVVPGVAGVIAALMGSSFDPTCLEAAPLDALLLIEAPNPDAGTVLLANPATWFAGLGGLIFLGFGALGVAAVQFRVARLPGRIQLRLDGAPHPLLARSLWLLLLAVAAPVPLLWLPLFGMVVAAGVRELADDAPGF